MGETFSGAYEDWRQKRFDRIVKHYGKDFFNGKTLLELGCANGDLGNMFHQLGAIVTCIDGRSEHIERLREKYPHLRAMVTDLNKPIELNEKFDIILHTGLLYHLSNYEQSIEDCASRCEHLILETEVCDSDDRNYVVHYKDNGAYDQSLNGEGVKPSPANVEMLLAVNRMEYERVFDGLNSGIRYGGSTPHFYDWTPTNTGHYEDGMRAFWFCKQKSMPRSYNDFKQLNLVVQVEGGGEFSHAKMTQLPFPLSIKIHEFECIRKLIIMNNLKRGFEIATGVGISALAAALGFSVTGGKLVSMDSYIEEKERDPISYRTKEHIIRPAEECEGYKLAKALRDYYKVTSFADFEIGWSPENVADSIRKHFSEPLDYAFIDGGHFPEQLRKDVEAIEPFIGKSGLLVFHDVYEETFTEDNVTYIEKTFGGEIKILVSVGVGENLGVLQINR